MEIKDKIILIQKYLKSMHSFVIIHIFQELKVAVDKYIFLHRGKFKKNTK